MDEPPRPKHTSPVPDQMVLTVGVFSSDQRKAPTLHQDEVLGRYLKRQYSLFIFLIKSGAASGLPV